MNNKVILSLSKLLLVASLYLPLAVSPASAQRIKGSDTMLPLSQALAEAFMAANPSTSVTVTGGGSGVGISALLENTTDLAQLSRKIKFDEKQKLSSAGKKVTETIVAFDALAVITHPSNSAANLTREQLEAIFTGKITNWKEVGGPDLKIIPYSRETSSGTYEFFKESVLKNKNYVNGILSLPATGAIIQSVSQTKGAIGYVGLAYLNASVKPVSVSYDAGATFVAPSVESAKNQSYPIVRPLYFYHTENAALRVTPFINFALSPQGQAIVAQTGFITVK